MFRTFYFFKRPVEFIELIRAENHVKQGTLKPEENDLLAFYYRETACFSDVKLGHWNKEVPAAAVEAIEFEVTTQEAIDALLQRYPELYCYGTTYKDPEFIHFNLVTIDTLEAFLKTTRVVSYTPFEIKCFESFWEHNAEDFASMTKEQAQGMYLAAQRMLRNKMLFKAQELLTRPQTHPTKAILEALQYGGLDIPESHTFEAMQEDSRKQFARAFPNLTK